MKKPLVITLAPDGRIQIYVGTIHIRKIEDALIVRISVRGYRSVSHLIPSQEIGVSQGGPVHQQRWQHLDHDCERDRTRLCEDLEL